MGIINVLDKHTAELIAAGEVVERPASVVKELVENSIDAGAKHITVEIKHGGTTFMRVSDDGSGFYRSDIKNAFLRHATSKVKTETDLNSIATLGFRGEALASICAVSKLRLITRSADEDVGVCYEIDGGDEVSFEDAGCPVGTTFVVRDLFYNVPARAKFLKKDISEGNAVSNIIDKTALSHPEIAFTYIKDGKQVLKTYGDGKLISAIYSVFGKDFSDGLLPVDYTLEGVRVYGYVSKPVHSRPNRNMQNFFINGRYVKTRTAMAALEEAYKNSVMVGKFPSCVLNLQLAASAVDVNVHPSKLEVRFVNERPVFDAVYHGVKSALMKHDGKKQAKFKRDTAFNDLQTKFNPFKNAPSILNSVNKPSVAAETKPIKEPESKPSSSDDDEFNPFSDIELNTNVKGAGGLKVADGGDNPFEARTSADLRRKNAFDNSRSRRELLSVFESSDKAAGKVEVTDKEEPPQNDSNADVDTDSGSGADMEEISPIIPTDSKNGESKPILKFLGEAFSTYIIAQKNNNELLLIDKHAAHERIIYEKLKAERAADYLQLLLRPVTVMLGKTEYDAAINHLDMFSRCGFEVEDFGNDTVLVRSAPQYVPAPEIPDCIAEMADLISKGKNDIYTEKMDWFYKNVACRSAIKAGDKSTSEELTKIIYYLAEHPEIKYCPHGRPICVALSRGEIEKQFGRT